MHNSSFAALVLLILIVVVAVVALTGPPPHVVGESIGEAPPPVLWKFQ